MYRKNIITILFAVITLTVSAQVSLPSSVLTDTKWRNEITGDWDIAFFENFAVYDCKFWDYYSVNEKGDRFDITLRSEWLFANYDDKWHQSLSESGTDGDGRKAHIAFDCERRH
jgi:hypothetical protein